MRRIAVLLPLLLMIFVGHAFAQANTVTSCGSASPFPSPSAGTRAPALYVDTNGNLCTNAGSLSGGFTDAATGTPISVTTGGVTGTLPAGAIVVATNVGATNGAYCKLGASATTSDQYLSPGGGWFAFQVGAATQLTCITSTSTTTVNMTGGSGLPTGTGGGGGGGGGAVTIASGGVASGAYSAGSIAAGAYVSGSILSGALADGAVTTIGTEADAAWSGSGNATLVALGKASYNAIIGNADPCNSATRTINLPVAFSSATTTQLAAGTGGKNIYLCELLGVPNGANNITIVAGTGSSCTSPTTILGPLYLANAGNGFDLGKGITSVAVTQSTGQYICATTSTANAIAITAITVLQ